MTTTATHPTFRPVSHPIRLAAGRAVAPLAMAGGDYRKGRDGEQVRFREINGRTVAFVDSDPAADSATRVAWHKQQARGHRFLASKMSGRGDHEGAFARTAVAKQHDAAAVIHERAGDALRGKGTPVTPGVGAVKSRDAIAAATNAMPEDRAKTPAGRSIVPTPSAKDRKMTAKQFAALSGLEEAPGGGTRNRMEDIASRVKAGHVVTKDAATGDHYLGDRRLTDLAATYAHNLIADRDAPAKTASIRPRPQAVDAPLVAGNAAGRRFSGGVHDDVLGHTIDRLHMGSPDSQFGLNAKITSERVSLRPGESKVVRHFPIIDDNAAESVDEVGGQRGFASKAEAKAALLSAVGEHERITVERLSKPDAKQATISQYQSHIADAIRANRYVKADGSHVPAHMMIRHEFEVSNHPDNKKRDASVSQSAFLASKGYASPDAVPFDRMADLNREYRSAVAASDAHPHRAAVRAAVGRGDHVPDEVLREYPDLKELSRGKSHPMAMAAGSFMPINVLAMAAETTGKHGDPGHYRMISGRPIFFIDSDKDSPPAVRAAEHRMQARGQRYLAQLDAERADADKAAGRHDAAAKGHAEAIARSDVADQHDAAAAHHDAEHAAGKPASGKPTPGHESPPPMSGRVHLDQDAKPDAVTGSTYHGSVKGNHGETYGIRASGDRLEVAHYPESAGVQSRAIQSTPIKGGKATPGQVREVAARAAAQLDQEATDAHLDEPVSRLGNTTTRRAIATEMATHPLVRPRSSFLDAAQRGSNTAHAMRLVSTAVTNPLRQTRPTPASIVPVAKPAAESTDPAAATTADQHDAAAAHHRARAAATTGDLSKAHADAAGKHDLAARGIRNRVSVQDAKVRGAVARQKSAVAAKAEAAGPNENVDPDTGGKFKAGNYLGDRQNKPGAFDRLTSKQQRAVHKEREDRAFRRHLDSTVNTATGTSPNEDRKRAAALTRYDADAAGTSTVKPGPAGDLHATTRRALLSAQQKYGQAESRRQAFVDAQKAAGMSAGQAVASPEHIGLQRAAENAKGELHNAAHKHEAATGPKTGPGLAQNGYHDSPDRFAARVADAEQDRAEIAAPATGIKPDLFGKPTVDPIGSRQVSDLFHKPVDVGPVVGRGETAADRKNAGKYDPKDTGTLPGTTPAGPKPSLSTLATHRTTLAVDKGGISINSRGDHTTGAAEHEVIATAKDGTQKVLAPPSGNRSHADVVDQYRSMLERKPDSPTVTETHQGPDGSHVTTHDAFNGSKVVSSSAPATYSGGRFKPADTHTFASPITGPSGASLTAYHWANEVGSDGKRRSDWTGSESSHATGKDIVHQFHVTPAGGGEAKMMSLESAVQALGYTDGKAPDAIKALAGNAKTLAALKMARPALVAQVQATASGGDKPAHLRTREEHATVVAHAAATRALAAHDAKIVAVTKRLNNAGRPLVAGLALSAEMNSGAIAMASELRRADPADAAWPTIGDVDGVAVKVKPGSPGGTSAAALKGHGYKVASCGHITGGCRCPDRGLIRRESAEPCEDCKRSGPLAMAASSGGPVIARCPKCSSTDVKRGPQPAGAGRSIDTCRHCKAAWVHVPGSVPADVHSPRPATGGAGYALDDSLPW